MAELGRIFALALGLLFIVQAGAPLDLAHRAGQATHEAVASPADAAIQGQAVTQPGRAKAAPPTSPADPVPGPALHSGIAQSPSWAVGNWSFRSVHGIDQAEALGYDGSGVVVGVADTGVDFCKSELRDALMTVGNLTVQNATVSQRTVGTLAGATLDIDGGLLWLKVYVNSTELAGTLYTFEEATGALAFDPPLGDGLSVSATYSYTPRNYGWPLVMDIGSLREYISRNQISEDSWYANTSATGEVVGGAYPTFEYSHMPPFPMSGMRSDFNTADRSFMDYNAVADDSTFWDGEAWLPTAQVSGGDFDLTDLYVTRDADNWYFGFGTIGAQANRTFGLYLDFDNATGGANIGPTGVADPRGYLVDAEASHTSQVNGVAYCANAGGKALTATCAAGISGGADQESILIWEAGKVARVIADPTEGTDEMRAVRWTPDGGMLVAASSDSVYAWDTGTWAMRGHVPMPSFGVTDQLSLSANGTWAAAATGTSRFSIIDLTSAYTIAHAMNFTAGGITQSAAFDPAGGRLAIGLGDGNIQIFTASSTPVNTLNLFAEVPGTGKGHLGGYPVRRLAWSPDGTRLATGGDDGRLIIWDASTGAILKAWNGTAGYEPLVSPEGEGAVGGLAWSADGLLVGTAGGKIIQISDSYTVVKELCNRRSGRVTALCAGPAGRVMIGGADCAVRSADIAASSPTALDYEACVMHMPDVVLYADYTAETYMLDENGDKVICTPDALADPTVYAWDSGAWSGSSLAAGLGGSAFYKGNKQIASETEGLTEVTVMGFVELAVPRALTDDYGSDQLSVKLFVAGPGPSAPQDSVPPDTNVRYPVTDFSTGQTRSLSSFGHVEFPQTTIQLTGIESQSGVYHYGVHPADSLRHFVQNGQGAAGNEYVGVLVVDANEPGVYDTVIIDLNRPLDPAGKTPAPNYAFDDEDPVATKASPFLALDIMDNSIYKNTSNPDGIYDYSAGLVYHISDGTPLPYSERLAELEAMNFDDEHPMPVPGPGDVVCLFGEFSTYEDSSIERVERRGTIAASAIAARGNIDDPQGYGPIAGAATGAKLAAVGRCDDHYERSLQFLAEGYDGVPGTGDDASIIYVGTAGQSYTSGLDEASHLIDALAVEQLAGDVTFVLPAGNDGPGFGTIASPAARNALVVGASSDNAYDWTPRPQQVFGQPLQFSARGPTASGYAKPDVMATGIARFSGPLTMYDTPGAGDENVVTYRDTRISAAIAAGAAAQFQQAYRAGHGLLPGMAATIAAVKSSARDMGYDALTQGAGLLDSLGAVRAARGEGAVAACAIDLVPSGYTSEDYAGFPSVMAAGSSSEDSVGLLNAGPATGLAVTAEMHSPVWSQTVHCGVSSQCLLNLTGMLPLNVSLLRVAASTPALAFFNPTTMAPDVIVKTAAVIADWPHDTDPFPAPEDMEILCEAELLDEFNVPTNVIELEVGQPQRMFDTSLWFVLRSTGKTVGWNVTLTGYAPEEWDWLTVSGAPAAMGAGDEAALNVTTSVPAGALPGSYSGSLRIASGPEDVAGEALHSPANGSVRHVALEEAGIAIGSVSASLENGNILPGTLELVRNRMMSGSRASYRDGPADNNAIAILAGAEAIPFTIQIPTQAGVPTGTPISNVTVSWASDDYGTPGDLSDDWWCSLWDSGYNEGSDYLVDGFTGGNITFTSDVWNYDGTIGWPGCEFYINYTYLVETSEPLAFPADYTADLAAGTITFASTVSADTVNVTANYSHVPGTVRRLMLSNPRIAGGLQLTRFNTVTGVQEAVPAADYEFSPVTGAILLDADALDIYIFNASYSHYRHTAMLPVLVNVGAARVPAYAVGGAPDGAINSPSRMYGGYCYGISDHAGDRRYFYFDVPEQGLYLDGEDFRSMFSLDWGGVPTDIDISMYARDDVVLTSSGKVAPYIFKQIGKGPASPSTRPGNFTTSSGGANETVIAPFETGLNVICLRAKLLAAEGAEHAFSGYGGALSIPGEGQRTLVTNRMDNLMDDDMSVEVTSNVDLRKGLHASVLGPALGKTYAAEEVWSDDIFYDITQEDWWRINAGAKYVRLVDVPEGTLTLDVHIAGSSDCADLDLCLFYDGKNGQEDGVAQWDEYIDRTLCEDIDNYGWGGVGTNFKTYAYSAGAGADEATKVLKPKPGTWIIKVVGYEVSGSPGHFDLTVKMIKEGVKGYTLSASIPDSDGVDNQVLHAGNLPRFTRVGLGVGWNFPGETSEDGSYSGIVAVGDAYSRGILPLPIDIILDREAPVLNEYSPKDGAYVSTSRPLIFCSFSDASRGEMDFDSIRISVDGKDITGIAAISAPRSKNTAGVWGLWSGSAVWTPVCELADGGHTVTVAGADLAGNPVEHSWGFTVDTAAPRLDVDGAADTFYTNEPKLILTGEMEEGSELRVLGIGGCTVSVDAGRFEAGMRLEAGENKATLICRDAAGNTRTRELTLVLDTVRPEMERLVSSEGALTRASYTTLAGRLGEPGVVWVAGEAVPVNSDGSFQATVALSEGANAIDVRFEDPAGNAGSETFTVTRDTRAPELALDDIPAETAGEWLNITGTAEAGSMLYVNGKPVDIGSRQSGQEFSASVRLSPGSNTVAVTCRDAAGNQVEEYISVAFIARDGSGTNYAAIGLMVALLAAGLLLGLFLGGRPFPAGGREAPGPDIADPGQPPEEAPAEPEMAGEGDAPEPAPGQAPDVPEQSPEGPLDIEPDMPRAGDGAADAPVQPSAEPMQREAPADEDPRVAKLKAAYEAGRISKELYERNLRKFREGK